MTTLISDTPPAGATPGQLWWESDTGYLYAWYNDGSSSQWVMVSPGSGGAQPATVAPIMDGVAAVGVASRYAREDHVHPKIYAAPFDAMAYSGMQINGSMEVNQAGGVAANGNYVVDGWVLAFSGTMVAAATQYAWGFGGYPNIAGVTITTAQASLGANDSTQFIQRIEGWRIARLQWGSANAQSLMVGFWSAHARTGVYTVSIRNGAADRSCAISYTHNVANVSQFNVVTFPGCTDGTWPTDNTKGMTISFAMAVGASLIAPAAGVWYSGVNYLGAPGQINGVAATTDTLRITGVVVLPGIEAPSAARAPLIMRPYDQELLTCQRYWQKFGGANVQEFYVYGYQLAGNPLVSTYPLRAIMRSNPTISAVGTFTVGNVSSGAQTASREAFVYSITPNATGQMYAYNNANSYFMLDARL
jgi:hypothetical protein